MGGYGDYDGYNNGYGGNEGQMMPMNGGASQEWRMPPMPAAQDARPESIATRPANGTHAVWRRTTAITWWSTVAGRHAARLVMTTRSMVAHRTVGSQYGGSQYGGWRRDPYGQDGDDGGRR